MIQLTVNQIVKPILVNKSKKEILFTLLFA